jgi:hypothetical protein
VLSAQGAAAEGIQTALHYGDGLDNVKNTAFPAAFRQKTGREADVDAVQGYDAGQMLAIGPDAAKGDATAIKPMSAAILAAKIAAHAAHSLCRRHITRRRRSICARRRAGRTASSGSRQKHSLILAPAAR